MVLFIAPKTDNDIRGTPEVGAPNVSGSIRIVNRVTLGCKSARSTHDLLSYQVACRFASSMHNMPSQLRAIAEDGGGAAQAGSRHAAGACAAVEAGPHADLVGRGARGLWAMHTSPSKG
ncbi:hypothetical protein PG984_003512 [Apiospora sp. TS-2023a]